MADNLDNVDISDLPSPEEFARQEKSQDVDISDLPSPEEFEKQQKEKELSSFLSSVGSLADEGSKFVDRAKTNLTESGAWQKSLPPVDFTGLTSDPNIQSAKEVDKFLNEGLWQLPKQTAEVVMYPIEATSNVGSGVVSGVMARAHGLMDDGIEGFLNPEPIKEVREKAKDLNAFQRVMLEIVPPLHLSEAIDETTKQDMLGFTEGLHPVLKPLIGDDGIEIARDFFLDVAGDPLTYLEFLPRSAPKSGLMTHGGLAEQAVAGERNLLAFKAPFAREPFYTVKAVGVLEAIDEFNATMQAKAGVGFRLRNFSQSSGAPTAEAARALKYLEQGEAFVQSRSFINDFEAIGGYDQPTVRLAAFMAEHGEDPGVMLAKKVGIKVDDIMFQRATNLLDKYEQINLEGNRIFKEATGIDLNERKRAPLTLDDKQKVIAEMKKRGIDVPRIYIDDGVVGYDLTFSENARYDFGRAAKEESIMAKKIDGAVEAFNSDAKASGFYTQPSSAKKRNPLSTEALNAIYRKAGISEEFFNANKSNVVLSKYLEKVDAASNYKYINTLMDEYGVLPGQEFELIEKSKQNVAAARAAGKPARYEDLWLSKLRPNDFVTIHDRAFERIVPFVGKEDKILLKAKSLRVPRNIAIDLESLGYNADKAIPLKAMSWLQQQLSKNMLTSPFRVTKQYADNVSRLWSIGALPEFLEEFNPFRKKDHIDVLAKMTPAISDTAWDMKDFAGKVSVNHKILNDKEVNFAYNAFLDTFAQMSKEGKQKEFLNLLGVKALKGAKAVAEFPGDNKLANWLRHVGNSADNVARRAAFRKFINQGYSARDSVYLVNRYLMDFQSTTNAVKKMRYVSPFASFLMKNVETLPRLLAMKPIAGKMLDPEDGYFANAWNKWVGLDSEQVAMLNRVLPFNRSPLYMPVVKGVDQILDKQKDLRGYWSQWAKLGMDEKEAAKMNGAVLSFDVPNFISGAKDALDLHSSLNSPFLKAMQRAFGIDPISGKKLSDDNYDKMLGAISELNPGKFPKFYNNVAMPMFAALSPKIAQSLRDGPLGSEISKIFGIEFGENALKKMKIDEDTIRLMTQAKFAGLAKVDQVDTGYYHTQMSLIQTMNSIVAENGGPGSLAEAITQKGKRQDVIRVMGRLQNIADAIKENTKVYNSMRTLFKRNLTPEEIEAFNSYKLDYNDDAPETEEVPQDSTIDGVDLEDAGREPQSVEPSMFDRASSLYRNHPELNEVEATTSIPQEPLDVPDGMLPPQITPEDIQDDTLSEDQTYQKYMGVSREPAEAPKGLREIPPELQKMWQEKALDLARKAGLDLNNPKHVEMLQKEIQRLYNIEEERARDLSNSLGRKPAAERVK